MATYKEKVGTAVVNYAGDYPGAVEGELWYDSTNKDFKYQYPNVTAAGSWRTSVSLNTARSSSQGASGTTTSALATGGNTATASYSGITELWDGSSWTEVNALNTARSGGTQFGTASPAATYAGGTYTGSSPYYTADTETWNGTNWTEVNNLNQSRGLLGGTGQAPQTASLVFGGDEPSPSRSDKTESWNGTNWTEVNDLNDSRYGVAGAAV